MKIDELPGTIAVLDEIATPVSDHILGPAFLAAAREEFAQTGFVLLPRFLRAQTQERLSRLLSQQKPTLQRRDFQMEEYGTARQMWVAGGRRLLNELPMLVTLYFHFQIHKVISEITGGSVFSCAHEDEFAVVNVLDGAGDTHGWHLDDPPFALVICVKSASDEAGGLLEFTTEKYSNASYARFAHANPKEVPITRHRLNERDAYLLAASEHIHRVSPLEGARSARWAINFAYQRTIVNEYGSTASTLYARDT